MGNRNCPHGKVSIVMLFMPSFIKLDKFEFMMSFAESLIRFQTRDSVQILH
jgi:hypothetical protein